MAINTVNISFQKELLSQIDQIAKAESRSRSELVSEAARMYIERKQRWKDIFDLGDSIQNEIQITEKDVIDEVKSSRSSK